MLSNLKKGRGKEEGAVAIEAALILPLMVTILIGVIDLGRGIHVNQKVVNATAMMADLITREDSLTDDELTDIAMAGQMAIEPYDTATFGYDVAGIQFTGADATPMVQWRDTVNMDPNGDIPADAEGLGEENEGLVAVTVSYTYTPAYIGVVIGTIDMQETFFARGRKTSFVTRL